jgi:2-haloacid dehalogenase
MSFETQPPTAKRQPPTDFQPRMLSFDVYGTLINTPPSNLRAFRRILLEASATNLDPIKFYSFWEQRNVIHYVEPYRSYKDICRLSLLEAFAHFGIGWSMGCFSAKSASSVN